MVPLPVNVLEFEMRAPFFEGIVLLSSIQISVNEKSGMIH
jgi:hypothetical protein